MNPAIRVRIPIKPSFYFLINIINANRPLTDMRPVYRQMMTSGSVLSTDMMTIKHNDEPTEAELDFDEDFYELFLDPEDQFSYLKPAKAACLAPEPTTLVPKQDIDTAFGIISGRKPLDCYTIDSAQPIGPEDDLIPLNRLDPPVPDLSQISSVRSPSPNHKLKEKIYRVLGRNDKPKDLDEFVSSHAQVRTFLERRSPGGGRLLGEHQSSWRGEQSELGGREPGEALPRSTDYSFQIQTNGDRERDLSAIGMLPLLKQTDFQPNESFEDWLASKPRPSYSWSQNSLT